MVELLGILLALLLAGLASLGLRLLRALRRRLAWLRRGGTPRCEAWRRTGRLGTARALGRSQAARIALLTAELERTRLALRLAEADRRRGNEAMANDRFRRAKRAFALRFHPDRFAASGPERALRRAIFQEFWAELRRIERG
ncbi:hypothetical protein [Siccirubricoccus sp. G192]|uniref:hypothetical protein n=1 Tax=Siccirubricoccus sp. G192 TaxID=2849651 RepID=UPI001C2C8108|nr:hypothetical protein [Siccirubricoccus sp. G192]MBV1797994.1 hypothetical protein [Siccirubricoccus sp. G192]